MPCWDEDASGRDRAARLWGGAGPLRIWRMHVLIKRVSHFETDEERDRIFDARLPARIQVNENLNR